MLNDLRILVVTYNVATQQPKHSWNELLGFHEGFYGTNELPDLYAIGFQEVPIKISDLLLEEPWVAKVSDVLFNWEYVKLKQVRMSGTLLVVYTKRSLLPDIRNVRTAYTRTGFVGVSGKGAVSIRMKLRGVALCIVNSHLKAGIDALEDRVHNYNSIIDGQSFAGLRTPNILSHDYVIWFGDLNFRLDDITVDEVIKLSKKHHEDTKHREAALAEMFSQDQLSKVRREGLAFSEFEEMRPKFMPSYKFIIGTNDYDSARKPAWTDRVLYKVVPDAYEGVKLSIRNSHYANHEHFCDSDHKPVTSIFYVKAFTRAAYKQLNIEEPLKISFLPVRQWHVYEECEAWFTISSEAPLIDGKRIWNQQAVQQQLSEHDWIALFTADFTSIDQHVTFVWVDPIVQRKIPAQVGSDVEQFNSTYTDENAADAADAARNKYLWFKVTFAEQDLIVPNTYRLVYFSHKLNNVLGMSDPFEVTYRS
ncbi:Inositol polyphosphate 5-phosphatase K [Halotydeus destructor]|nr:Inositol polyphosphate 5-phosphatase K [Halotydeus destructor]